ncbi:MAG TPA: sulfite exporter TauE/SafE family protein [Thermodesulfobacteriota bacterium]
MTPLDLVLVGVSAFLTSTIAGLSGYGAGLLMPLVLAPVLGAQAVVPVLAVAALFNNASRLLAFRDQVDWRRAAALVAAAVPTCILGATFYTRLDARQASCVIGLVLLLLVPARRRLGKRLIGGSTAAGVASGAVYGLLIGSAPGAGLVLIPILMGMGLAGRAVVATDSAVSLTVGLVKVSTFQAFGFLPAAWWAAAIVIGLCGVPGAFVARWLGDRLHARVLDGILDAGVVIGGGMLLLRGLGLA